VSGPDGRLKDFAWQAADERHVEQLRQLVE
jgi:hypothetical protein